MSLTTIETRSMNALPQARTEKPDFVHHHAAGAGEAPIKAARSRWVATLSRLGVIAMLAFSLEACLV
ncbi:MAG: hypothetical protein AAF942_01795, partial [Pseudomonadota bacterium]